MIIYILQKSFGYTTAMCPHFIVRICHKVSGFSHKADSWNQPVLSNEGTLTSLKSDNVDLYGVQTDI